MNTPANFVVAAALALVVAGPVLASPHGRHGFMGGPGCAGAAFNTAGAAAAPLSPDQVKKVIEGRLTMQRSDRHVGTVTEKDAQSYDVQLVKPDGSPAEHLVVDKATGHPAGFGGRAGHGGGPAMVREKPLTAEQVRDIIAGRIAWRGEDAKVGKVVDKDADTVRAEVVDASGKVIRTVEVNKKTGCFSPVQ